MSKLDQFREFQWRSMTSEEASDLADWLELRKQVIKLSPDELDGFIMPEAPFGIKTAEGAAQWALIVFWQDSPVLLVLGITSLVGRIALELWNFSQRMM